MTNAVNLASAAGTGFFRNRLINPWFRVAQRGTTGASGYCSVDRWFGSSTTSFNQVVDGPTNLFTRALEFGTTNAVNGIAVQRMEAVNVYDLIGQQVTVSFWAKSSSGSSMTLNADLMYPTALDDWTSQAAIEAKSVTITSSWAYYTLTFAALPSDIANGLSLRIYRLGSSITRITGVQLEAGATATTFERRNYGAELALCQRYFWQASIPLGGIWKTDTPYAPCVRFPVTMRTTPTLASGASFTTSGSGPGTPAISSGTTGISTSADSVWIYNSASNWSVNGYVSLSAGFNAEL